MSKVTLNTLSSGYASVAALNDNFDLIEEGFDNTLSRDGSTPNTMAASLDMDSNPIVNLGAPTSDTDAARLVDISDSDATGAASAQLRADLGSTVTNFGASLVGIEDAAGDFTATTVEGAIAEIQADLEAATASIIPLSTIDAAGDLIVGTAADTVARKAVGAAGTVLMSQAASSDKLVYVPSLNKAIYGLTYANNVADATNDLDMAVGGAMDATGAYWMTLASSLTKQSDVAWAVGSAAGGLDTGAVGDSEYYVWLIARSDTGVVDILFSLSSTAPTMPANYDFKRLIGWFKRTAGVVVPFVTYEVEGGGLEFAWKDPTQDVNLDNTLTTTRRTDTINVPTGFSVRADLSVNVLDATSTSLVIIYCPDKSDISAANGFNLRTNTAAAEAAQMFVRTSATGQIAARSSLATIDIYDVWTHGFIWDRRN
jgi:hypothetical protein